MKLKMIATMAAAVAAAPLLAQVQGPQPTLVTLSAEGSVKAEPDVADIGAGVVTSAPEAAAAMQANAQQMSRVVDALRRAGVAARDIQTAGINLQPQYRYEENQPPQLVGYRAENRVQAVLRNPGQAGRVIDALVAAGANQINGPTFRVDKPEPLFDKARQQAVTNGRARAELYAAAAGMRVKRVLAITEAGATPPPMPMPRMMAAKAEAMDASSPVMPGELALDIGVNMVFELE
ncbi:MAG: SIMPL domain-containing protein [Sphingomonadaceae bacterium]